MKYRAMVKVPPTRVADLSRFLAFLAKITGNSLIRDPGGKLVVEDAAPSLRAPTCRRAGRAFDDAITAPEWEATPGRRWSGARPG
jgi:hypothetical protein